MTDFGFDAILDECLSRLAAGDSVEACLEWCPPQADQLKPLLKVAAGLRALPVPEPRSVAVEAGRQRMLAAYRRQQTAKIVGASSISRLAARIRDFFLPVDRLHTTQIFRLAVAAVLLVLLVGANLAVVASAGTIPGDPLYRVKRSWEEARLAFAVRAQSRIKLRDEFLQRRQVEVSEMRQRGRQGILEIDGALQSVGEDRWSVDGLLFEVTRQTHVEGVLKAGAAASIRMQLREDGTLVALIITARTAPLVIEPDPRRTPDSPAAGADRLEMTATEAAADRARQTPGETPVPQPTRTPEPTTTPRPTITPRPTRTPEPTQTPAVVEPPDAEDESTAEPTRCLECTVEPPEETVEPEHPTETREPEHTPEPTATPEPKHTTRPTRTPKLESTAVPTATKHPENSPTAQPSTAEPTATPRRSPEPTHSPEEKSPTPVSGESTPAPSGTPRSTSHD
jgi:hypothetical protein